MRMVLCEDELHVGLMEESHASGGQRGAKKKLSGVEGRMGGAAAGQDCIPSNSLVQFSGAGTQKIPWKMQGMEENQTWLI